MKEEEPEDQEAQETETETEMMKEMETMEDHQGECHVDSHEETDRDPRMDHTTLKTQLLGTL